MRKLLVQVRASPNDPRYSDQLIKDFDSGESIEFGEFFKRKGIDVLEEDLIVSCHGCPDLTDKVSRQINNLAKHNRVGVIATGGLFFGLPSIMAARMPTVPVISVPLDGGWYGGADALLAPNVPSGTAAIAGTGFGDYAAAAIAMRNILNNDFQGVHTYNADDKMLSALERFGVPVLGDVGNSYHGRLIVGRVDEVSSKMGDLPIILTRNSVAILTPVRHDNQETLQDILLNTRALYTRGEENAAIFAAKAMAAYNLHIAERLGELSVQKGRSYKQRDITLESFTGARR